MKKQLLNEIKESMEAEKQFNKRLDEIRTLFEKLEKKDFNNNILRQMQITASIGIRPKIYLEENLLEMLKYSEQLIESNNKILSQIGKKMSLICTNILERDYDSMIMTEFSSNSKYHPNKKLFSAFQNMYSMSSKLF